MRANFARPLLALFAAISLSAETPTFKSRADLVQVPVVVQDRHGSAVSGLSSDEFVLEQDGKPQRIASIKEITTGTEPKMTPPAGALGVFHQLFIVQRDPRSNIFLL